MIEIWLSDSQNRLRLPVLPEMIGITSVGNHEKVMLHSVGEALLKGQQKLKTMEISSYFPARYDTNCGYRNIPSPDHASSLCQGWTDSGTVLQLVITGAPLPVNMPVVIESYAAETGRPVGAVDFKMSLSQYRPLTATRVETVEALSVLFRRPKPPPPPPPMPPNPPIDQTLQRYPQNTSKKRKVNKKVRNKMVSLAPHRNSVVLVR